MDAIGKGKRNLGAARTPQVGDDVVVSAELLAELHDLLGSYASTLEGVNDEVSNEDCSRCEEDREIEDDPKAKCISCSEFAEVLRLQKAVRVALGKETP